MPNWSRLFVDQYNETCTKVLVLQAFSMVLHFCCIYICLPYILLLYQLKLCKYLILIVMYILYTFPVATFDPDSKFISNVVSRLEAVMGVHIVSILANIHYQLTTSIQLQPQDDKHGRIIPIPEPGQYVEEVIFQWSAGRSPRPPTWRELLQVLQDIGQLELRQQIEAFMKGMCTDMYTCMSLISYFHLTAKIDNFYFFQTFRCFATCFITLTDTNFSFLDYTVVDIIIMP